MRRRHQNLNFAGTMHFVTTVTRERGNWFTNPDQCKFILELFEKYRAKFEIACLGFVLMPYHFHVLLYQEQEGSSVSSLMNSFKRETSKQLDLVGYSAVTLWRDRYDDVRIPGPDAVTKRLNYMHHNPVRRGIEARLLTIIGQVRDSICWKKSQRSLH